MTALYKKIYTKSSLNDAWFFETNLNNPSDPFENPESKFNGYISKSEIFEPTVSIDELESRKSELNTIRPDLYNNLFETKIEDLDFNLDYTINYLKKYNIPLPFNPFTTILTGVVEFDTWENLIFAYESLVTVEVANSHKEILTKINNNLVEEFYLDGVKQSYVGKIV
jgi:hypothetical protein